MVAGRPHLLIVNPSSGGGRAADLLDEVERELDKRHMVFRVVKSRNLEHGAEEARVAAGAGEVPVVISGDGLIGAVGGALARTETPMGVIPGGRGNDFARVTGIPTSIPEAISVLRRGEERRIDVGEVNGRRFLCIASAGFDSECNRLANDVKLIRGNLVYAYAALRTLITWRAAAFTVTVDGVPHRHRGYSVAVANGGAYGGGMLMAPDAELDDGLFDIVLTGEVGKLRFVANLPKVFKGTHVRDDEVSVLRGSRVEIRSNRPFEVYADGEPLTQLPATLRVLRGALRLIAPPLK
ncbi:MAG: diacylglycerol kinase family protein [Solirubrobacterales bacterium]